MKSNQIDYPEPPQQGKRKDQYEAAAKGCAVMFIGAFVIAIIILLAKTFF
jgi:hypothetical protein